MNKKHKSNIFIIERLIDDYSIHPVKDFDGYNEGLKFQYINSQKQYDYVYAPHTYKPLLFKQFTFIAKRIGNNSACPIFDLPGDKDCPGEDLSALIRTDVNTRGYKTLYRKNLWALIIIGIAAIIAVGIIAFAITQFTGNDTTQPSPPPTQMEEFNAF